MAITVLSSVFHLIDGIWVSTGLFGFTGAWNFLSVFSGLLFFSFFYCFRPVWRAFYRRAKCGIVEVHLGDDVSKHWMLHVVTNSVGSATCSHAYHKLIDHHHDQQEKEARSE